MKRLVFAVVVALLVLPLTVHADRVTLGTAETLAVPTSALLDWRVTLIDAKTKTLEVSYQWLDANLNPIRANTAGQTWRVWTCRDRAPELVASCTEPGIPYACCTGPGAGTGCDPGDDCFSSIFRFKVRAQDVGTDIGIGLRTLIWNKFKAQQLSAGNTGVFDAN